MKELKSRPIKFKRTTHDQDGNYLGDSQWKISQKELDQKIHGLGIHTWGRSGEELSLEEYISENFKYYHQEGEPVPTVLELIHDLCVLLNYGSVVAINETGKCADCDGNEYVVDYNNQYKGVNPNDGTPLWARCPTCNPPEEIDV